MRYKRIAVTLLAIVILISVAYLNIGGCNKDRTCHFFFTSISEQECSDDADARSCNEFEFNPEDGECLLHDCSRCNDDIDSTSEVLSTANTCAEQDVTNPDDCLEFTCSSGETCAAFCLVEQGETQCATEPTCICLPCECPTCGELDPFLP